MTVIACPVDGCPHLVHATPPDVPPGALDAVFGPGVFAAAAAVQHARHVEDKLAEHLRSHTLAEFVATITRLRNLVADLTAQQQSAAADG